MARYQKKNKKHGKYLVESDTKLIGKILQNTRLSHGFSRRQLAVAIGVKSPETIGNWERGISEPPAILWVRLIKFLRIDVSSFGI